MGIACLFGGHNYELVEETEDTRIYQCTKCMDTTRSYRRRKITSGKFGDWDPPVAMG